MKLPQLVAILTALLAPLFASEPWTDTSPHKSGFVSVNGVKLHYLDWGGSGPSLVLIPGAGNNPHVYDSIAPKLTDKFRVVSYARRGDADSEDKAPYDVDTMAEDLRQFLNTLGIQTPTHLAGWSLGGFELTRFAGLYPDRVGKLVYLDAGYDWYASDVLDKRPAIGWPR